MQLGFNPAKKVSGNLEFDTCFMRLEPSVHSWLVLFRSVLQSVRSMEDGQWRYNICLLGLFSHGLTLDF